MRPLFIAAIVLGGLIPSANAQRGGGGGGGRGGAVARPGFGAGGMQGARAGNWRNGNWAARGWNSRTGFSGMGYAGNGYGGLGFSGQYPDSGWAAEYGDGDQAVPLVLMMPVQAPPEPEPPPPPPEPARPVMHEYNWTDSAGNPAARFSIVSGNGAVHQAVAVWVQGNEVRYTMAGGSTGSVAAAAVDCGATDRLNARDNLKLVLPGCAAR